MIGGISYFHKYAYDLLATNERILASTFDFAISRFKQKSLKRILVLSSSMVFERTNKYPTPESEVDFCLPPLSTYGFQKLACEYFCKGAFLQYKLPYTIIRPFNCVGVGEMEPSLLNSNANFSIMTSHVLPDIVYKAMRLGNSSVPLPILGDGTQIRNYTNGVDIAKSIRIALESNNAINEDFNVSSNESLTVIELANLVYQEIYNCDVQKFEFLEPFQYDVHRRIPDTTKAKKILNFSCDIPATQSVKEVVSWFQQNIKYV